MIQFSDLCKTVFLSGIPIPTISPHAGRTYENCRRCADNHCRNGGAIAIGRTDIAGEAISAADAFYEEVSQEKGSKATEIWEE